MDSQLIPDLRRHQGFEVYIQHSNYKMYRYILLTILISFITGNLTVNSQSHGINRDKFRIHIEQTSEKINIDGSLDEEVWKTAERSGKFTRVTPVDTGYAIAQTDVMMSYDESNIYLAAICYDPTPGKRIIQSLRRDFNFSSNDNFMVFIDTYNDLTNGFAFGVSAAGVQRDGMEANGDEVAYTWDSKWKSAVKSYNDMWIAEMSIPFHSIRYREGSDEWGINFGRFDLKTNEKSAWGPMPRQFSHNNLAFTGTLIWDKPLKKTVTGLSVIPYAIGKVTGNNEAGSDPTWSANAGLDAKVILAPSMNLDLTFNPDFSQVEEDRQVTNLDRFELFFPERRQFFLENTHLFSALGKDGIQPFFSRRIGLNAPVFAGGRLSGQISPKMRIGLLEMQTGSKNDIPAANFAALVVQRQVFRRSSLTAFMVNKQITSGTDTMISGYRYNRVAGLEFNLASSDDKWTGKTFYHRAFYTGASADAATASGSITYSTPHFIASVDQSWVGDGYNAETGYIRRTGYLQTSPRIKATSYPSKGNILSHGLNASFDIILDPAFSMTDRTTKAGYFIGWKNRNQITVTLSDHYVRLKFPFDPTNMRQTMLPEGSEYTWLNSNINFTSDTRRLFYFSLDGGYGSYYNGHRTSLGGNINYRIQPYGSITLTASYNNIKLPEPYSSAELILLGPMLDLTFSKSLFLTTFVQYNNQIDNLNTNIRFQWHYAPASDLFIVYTSNAFIDNFRNRNRGLAVKISYWFN